MAERRVLETCPVNSIDAVVARVDARADAPPGSV